MMFRRWSPGGRRCHRPDAASPLRPFGRGRCRRNARRGRLGWIFSRAGHVTNLAHITGLG
eukprot:5210700-Lingulodinium_polyedra.AAC.1